MRKSEIKIYLKNLGFNLKSIDVINNKTTAIYECPQGHELKKACSDIGRSKSIRCTRCTSLSFKDNVERRLSANKFTMPDLRDGLKSDDIVEVVCSEGHIRKGRLALYIHNYGCKVCAGKESDEDTVRYKLLNEGYELLSRYEYISRPATLRHLVCERAFDVNSLLNHVNDRGGCPHCTHRIRKDISTLSDLIKVNGWKFKDSEPYLSDYTKSEVELECIRCGFSRFGIIGNYMYKGIQCPICKERPLYGFQKDIPATLYYLRVQDDYKVYYKIGITNLSVKERFCNSDLEKITVLSELHYEEGWKVQQLEKYFLDTFSEYRYKGEPILASGGNTELFVKDVLELDNP